jgi:hypothetical protein
MALYSKLAAPIGLPELALTVTLDEAEARVAMTRAITDSVLRPADIARAKIGEAAFFYAPFWRVSLSVEGFHIGLTTVTSDRGRTMPLPTGGARHASGSIMISARAIVPYTPKLPSTLGRLSTAPALEVDPSELVPTSRAADALAGRELVEADVSKEQAERIAVGMILHQVQPHSALYAKYDPVIHSSLLLYYPLYLSQYRYEGEARSHAGEEFFAMLSGRTGKVVAAKHPSALRAVTAKLRRFLSFDFRD